MSKLIVMSKLIAPIPSPGALRAPTSPRWREVRKGRTLACTG